MPSTCKFSFTKDPPVYYAGEDTVVGTISLTTTSDKEVYFVCLYFRGNIKCRCSILSNIFKCAPSCIIEKFGYTYGEEIFNEKRLFFGEGTFEAKEYNFSFSFPINERCPTSLESKNGQIRYELCLVISNKEKYRNIFTKPITVIKRQNLSNNPYLLEKQFNMKSLSTWCGLVKKPLFISLETPIGAYAPGQTLRYTIESNNKTPEEILGYSVQLARFTQTGSKVCKAVMYSINLSDNDEYTQIINGEINIPSTPPSMNLRHIKVWYELVAVAKHALKRHNLRAKLEIIIGTTPLPRSSSDQVAAETLSRAHVFVVAEKYEKPFVDLKAAKINRVEDFLPHYPMYNTTEPANNEN